MKGIYVIGDEYIIHDPSSEDIPFLSRIQPSFRVESIRPPKGFVPRFQRLRNEMVVLDSSVFELSLEELRKILAGEAP